MGNVADANELKPSRIVRIEKPHSSTGTPAKPHYFVVIYSPDVVKLGDAILLVGVSSTIAPAALDPARHIAMKWLDRPAGDPETGFTRRCYACIDFTHVLKVYEGREFDLEVAAKFEGKFVRSEKLQTIVAAMNAWARRK